MFLPKAKCCLFMRYNSQMLSNCTQLDILTNPIINKKISTVMK